MEELKTLRYQSQYWLNWRQIYPLLYSSKTQRKPLDVFKSLADMFGCAEGYDYVNVLPNMTCSGFAAGDVAIRLNVAETLCAYRRNERAVRLCADIAKQRRALELQRADRQRAAYGKLQQQLRDAAVSAQNQIAEAQQETRRYADALAEVKRVATQFSTIKPRTYTGVVVSYAPTEQLSPTVAMAFRTDADEVATPSTPVEVTFATTG